MPAAQVKVSKPGPCGSVAPPKSAPARHRHQRLEVHGVGELRQGHGIRPGQLQPAVEIRHHAAGIEIGLKRAEFELAAAQRRIERAAVPLRHPTWTCFRIRHSMKYILTGRNGQARGHRKMNLAGWVEKWGRAAGERTAIAFGAAPYASYRQWAARSRVLAGNLRALCRPDDRVAIAMTNRPEFLEALFAIWHAGLVAVPMNAKLHADELGYIIGHAQASLILASPDLADDVAPHGRTVVTGSAEWRRLGQGDGVDVVPRSPDDLAWLFYTSGTTGRPKGAMLTHRNLMAMTLAYLVRHRAGRRRQCQNSPRAAVARLRTLRAAPLSPWAPGMSYRNGRLRSRRDRLAAWRRWQCQFLCRADHGQPAGQPCGVCRRRSSRLAHHRLWRRRRCTSKTCSRPWSSWDRNSRRSTARARRR